MASSSSSGATGSGSLPNGAAMMSPTAQNARKQMDFTKLISAGYEVDLIDGSSTSFYVTVPGPKETIYEGAIYRIKCELPDQYPFSSPSIGFEPYTIFHPNIDERSGSVCLDVINQTWTPLYSLVNIFDTFLPQLLTYPNPSDPLNTDAASLFAKDTKRYEERVKKLVADTIEKHRQREAAKSGGLAGGGAGATATPNGKGNADEVSPAATTATGGWSASHSINQDSSFDEHERNSEYWSAASSAGGSGNEGLDDDAMTSGQRGDGIAAAGSGPSVAHPAGGGGLEFQFTNDGEEDDLDLEFG